jgi:hypothetical protein
MRKVWNVRSILALLLVICSAAACGKTENPGPTSPTPPPTANPNPAPPPAPTPTVTSVTVNATTTTFSAQGATAQFTAVATLSNGSTEDRTSTASWQSSNTVVATVTALGVVTALQDGDAQITATVSDVRGSRNVSVRIVRRTPDPQPGQRLPLPDVQGVIAQLTAARPDLFAQQCSRGLKYVRNPWLDYIVDELRKLDTRWGYNAKPNRSAADNEGVPVEVAGDEITYHFGPGPDEGSSDVYPIDILVGHCGPTPSLTWRVFTGEEPARWTGSGRF